MLAAFVRLEFLERRRSIGSLVALAFYLALSVAPVLITRAKFPSDSLGTTTTAALNAEALVAPLLGVSLGVFAGCSAATREHKERYEAALFTNRHSNSVLYWIRSLAVLLVVLPWTVFPFICAVSPVQVPNSLGSAAWYWFVFSGLPTALGTLLAVAFATIAGTTTAALGLLGSVAFGILGIGNAILARWKLRLSGPSVFLRLDRWPDLVDYLRGNAIAPLPAQPNLAGAFTQQLGQAAVPLALTLLASTLAPCFLRRFRSDAPPSKSPAIAYIRAEFWPEWHVTRTDTLVQATLTVLLATLCCWYGITQAYLRDLAYGLNDDLRSSWPGYTTDDLELREATVDVRLGTDGSITGTVRLQVACSGNTTCWHLVLEKNTGIQFTSYDERLHLDHNSSRALVVLEPALQPSESLSILLGVTGTPVVQKFFLCPHPTGSFLKDYARFEQARFFYELADIMRSRDLPAVTRSATVLTGADLGIDLRRASVQPDAAISVALHGVRPSLYFTDACAHVVRAQGDSLQFPVCRMAPGDYALVGSPAEPAGIEGPVHSAVLTENLRALGKGKRSSPLRSDLTIVPLPVPYLGMEPVAGAKPVERFGKVIVMRGDFRRSARAQGLLVSALSGDAGIEAASQSVGGHKIAEKDNSGARVIVDGVATRATAYGWSTEIRLRSLAPDRSSTVCLVISTESQQSVASLRLPAKTKATVILTSAASPVGVKISIDDSPLAPIVTVLEHADQ